MVGKLDFKEFSPSDDLVQYTELIFAQIMDLVPRESVINAQVVRSFDTEFTCQLEIFSQSEDFKARSSAQDPRLAVDGADQYIRRQISAWRTACIMKDKRHCWPEIRPVVGPHYWGAAKVAL